MSIAENPDQFDQLWQDHARETAYLHWTRDRPVNQIQLAFRSHWLLFREIMGPKFAGRRVLELGSGRGSLSAYFSEAGFDCTLLDVSPTVMDTARNVFREHGLRAEFVVADAYETELPDGSFDVVFSIGLLEHLERLEAALAEQVRLLAPGGVLFAYVVPENSNNVQRDYRFVNEILALYDRALQGKSAAGVKPVVYRSDANSEAYLKLLARLPMRDVSASGVYPLPMISPSTTFPFTLMPPPMEAALTRHFEGLLTERAASTGRNPWLCDEDFGQAFLVWGWRK